MKTMKQWLVTGLVCMVAAGAAWGATGTSGAVTVRSLGSYNVEGHMEVGYPPFKVGSGDEGAIWLDGAVLFSTSGSASWDWQPQTTGNHTIEFRLNGVAVTSKTVNVSSLAFWVQKAPNPPTAVDSNLSITPVTRNFGTGGGGAAIVVSGSGTWKASVSDPWITLNATSGAAGTPVAYVVGAATNAESRTGYVYVSGYVHTVTQDGLGATISPESATFESAGGTGKITVTPPDRMSWQARANVDWVNVSPVNGTGAGTVTFTVAPLNEVVTRQGTLTVGGQTFTVFQYGRRIKLSPKEAEYDYLTHVIPITVDALAITSWTVEPKNSWISVVDGGNGHGGDLVTVAIGENPSWKARTGTVKIGTETFTVTQAGRTALEFGINPEKTTASVEGANGLIAVTATPDLPWSAASQANWLTIYSDTGTGAGNGNVVYSAAPNPTLYERTGTIKVTPGDSKVSAKTHTVTQPAAVSALSANGYEFEAAGESCEVRVSLSDIVQWQIENPLAWLTVSGSTNRVGPGTVTLQAAPNDTVYPRSGTVTIARKAFKVSQKARGVEVEYETKLFGTDGGSDSISIHPDGQVSWTAVSSDKTWITIFGGGSGTGDGEILYIVSPYVGDGASRTGTITVGDKVVYITQRAYDLSIDPAGAVVPGNNGAGEFGVSASIGDVWTAIVTEPWITIVDGYDQGTGNGTVRFLYTDNDTGKMRTGKIIVAGEVYTLTQKARELVEITAVAEHGGTVEGAGPYDLGTKVTLTAVPDSGYEFSHWTGDIESMENPLVFNADVPKSFTAVFTPLPIAFESVVSGTNGVTLAWNNLAWATHYLLYRGTTSVPSSATVLADIPNTGDCTFLDDTGELEVEYWYWIEAEGVEDDVMGDPMTGKKKWGWPDAKDEAEVAAALGEAEDVRLGEHIGSVGEYEAFRAWSAEEGRGEKAVKDSPLAWPSYALGTEALLENEPTVVLEMGVGGSRAKGVDSGVVMEVRVTVKDGDKEVFVDAAKIATMFEATGDLLDWDGEGKLSATATLTGSDGATMHFEVVPDDGTAGRAFLRFVLSQGKTPQTIHFASIDEQVTTNRVELSATASSGGTVTFKVVSGPGVVEGNVLSFTGAGRVVVRAFQRGDGQWLPATAIQMVLVKAEQEISFAAVGARTWQDRVELSATATSGKEVAFEVVSGPGEIQGNELTFTESGSVVVRAVQVGSDLWLPASATQTVSVAKAPQTITFGAIAAQFVADYVTLSATATGGGDVKFEVGSGPGEISGNVLTFTGVGRVEVRAIQEGDDLWLPATTVQAVHVVADESEFLYMVVDLSAGSGADAVYPVSYLASEPDGGWTDEYKTTKLVLRRIEGGRFARSGWFDTMLTKPYFIGVFEVTQKQYELVTGIKPALYQGDMRPVENVSWNTIRGDNDWPNSTAVSAASFMGRLRARTDVAFDLPTDAQWEYACRAGTDSHYNNGGDTDEDLKPLGRYAGTRSDGKGGYSDAHTTVGSYLPNAWGLYDMHGNVIEWCLDWMGGPPYDQMDPVGPTSGDYREARGGSWESEAGQCSALSVHFGAPSSYAFGGYGFRISTIQEW